MTPREKAISVLGQYFPMVSDMNMELIDSIIDAARESMVTDGALSALESFVVSLQGRIAAIERGMVGEDRVKELIADHNRGSGAHMTIQNLCAKTVFAEIASHDESLLAHLPAFTEREKLDKEFVEQRLSAHRNEEHLPNGGLRRNAAPTENAPYDAMANAGKQREFAAQTFERIQTIGEAIDENAGNSERVFISAEQAEAVIQALQDEYGGYNDKYTARDARAVYSLVDPDVESSKPSPAPWTPKMGELAWSDDDEAGYFGICTIESAREEWTQIKCQSGSLTNVRTSKLRPLRASDWIVKVKGFEKVEAWYDENGGLWVRHDNLGKGEWYYKYSIGYTAALGWLKTHNVPVKPFGWEEGE